MGWYDSYGGRPDRVNMSAITSNTGSAAKNFGDAFTKIGTSIMDVNAQESKNKLVASQQTLADTNNTIKKNELDSIKIDNDKKVVNDAYLRAARSAKSKDELNEAYPTTKNISIEAMNKADTLFQGKFDNEAQKKWSTAGYATIKDFKKAEPNLYNMMSTTTLNWMKKDIKDKNTALANLSAKEKDVKHAMALNKLQAKVVKATKASGKLKSGAGKPLTLGEQVIVEKLFESNFYKLDDKGKPEITEGHKVLKDGVSPEQLKFVQEKITSYMANSNSDKNYAVARDNALAEWAETPRAKLEAEAKQINDSNSWYNHTVTPKELQEIKKLEQSTVESEDRTTTHQKENSSFGWEKYYSKALNQK